MTAAAQDIKAVSLELGGKSPFVVFGDSDLDEAVEWIMFGIFWNQGQVCSATSRVLVDETIYDALRRAAGGGKPQDRDRQRPRAGRQARSAGQSQAKYEKVQGFVNEGRRDGARLVSRRRASDRASNAAISSSRPCSIRCRIRAGCGARKSSGRSCACAPSRARTRRSPSPTTAASASPRRSCRPTTNAAERVAAQPSAPASSGSTARSRHSPKRPGAAYKHRGIGRELGRWGLDNYLEIKQMTAYKSDKPWGWYGG